MKKRQIALGMVAVLLASGLAACGGAKKAETTGAAEETTKAAEESKENADAKG